MSFLTCVESVPLSTPYTLVLYLGNSVRIENCALQAWQMSVLESSPPKFVHVNQNVGLRIVSNWIRFDILFFGLKASIIYLCLVLNFTVWPDKLFFLINIQLLCLFLSLSWTVHSSLLKLGFTFSQFLPTHQFQCCDYHPQILVNSPKALGSLWIKLNLKKTSN